MSLINIDQQDIADWHGSETPAFARLAANQEFMTSEGVIVAPGAGLWQQFTASVVSNKIRIAAGVAYSTTDSDTPWATYSLSIYSAKGKLLLSLPVAIRIPATPSSTTWDAILQYSQAILQPFRSAYYTTDQLNVLLAGYYTQGQINALLAAKVSDTALGASWDGVTGIAPSKNAVYDAIVPFWSVVNKSVDENRTSSAVLANDSELAFSVTAPAKNVPFELGVWYSTPSAADFQFGFTFPSANISYRGEKVAPDGTITALTGNGVGSFASQTILSAIDGTGSIYLRGILQNVGAGTVNFQWAQNTSNGSPTNVYSSSYLKFRSN